MKRRRSRRLVLAVAVTAVLAGFVVGAVQWRLAQRREVIAAALPPVPEFDAPASPVRTAVLAAHRRATSRDALAGLRELARVYHANGFYERVPACYEALEALDADEPRWPYYYALILAGYGDLEPAMQRWRRVISLAPDYLPARLRLADAALKSNALEEARAAYREILDRWPDEPYALLGLARMDFEAQRWPEARERLEQVVAATDYRLGYDLIVSAYERLGMVSEAQAIRGQMKASGAFREAPDPWADELLEVCFDPYRLALAAGATADPVTAKALLLRAIRLAPDDVSYRLQLVSLHTEERDATAALRELRELTRRAPDFADGWARLASLQQQLGDQAGAVQTLSAGLAHAPDSPGLRLMWGSMLRKAGRHEEAMRELQASIRLRPNEAAAYLELAQVYVELRDVEAGVAELRRSLEAEPDNPGALTFLAFHAISTGDQREADHWMELVARQPRVGAQPAQHLERVYREAFGRAWRRE